MKSVKNIFKLSRTQWISVAVLASSVGLAAAVTVTSFTSGTLISASAMNANFTALVNALPAVKTLQTTSSGLFPAAEGDLRTFPVTTLGAGQVVITMSGYLRITHTTGTASQISLFVRQAATKFRVITQLVPAGNPTASVINEPFSFTAAFPVAAAGTNNIIVSGLSNVPTDWGDCGAVVLGCPVVTLQYVPGTLP